MAKTKSAKKATRISARRHVFNVRRQKAMKDTLKEIAGLFNEKKAKEATEILSRAFQVVDKAAKRGVVKKNTAARIKSRITKRLRAIAS